MTERITERLNDKQIADVVAALDKWAYLRERDLEGKGRPHPPSDPVVRRNLFNDIRFLRAMIVGIKLVTGEQGPVIRLPSGTDVRFDRRELRPKGKGNANG